MKNKSNFYLGLFLVILGLLLLLDNLHYVDLSLYKILHLWPLLLILWGLKYIPMNESLRHLSNWTIILLFFGLLLFGPDMHWRFTGPWGNHHWHTKVHYSNDDDSTDTGAKDIFFTAKISDEIKAAKMELVVPAVELQLGEPTNELYSLALEDFPIPYRSHMDVHDSIADIRLTPEKHGDYDLETYNPTGTLQLNANIPWDLNIKSGASDLDLDLSPYRVKKLSVKSGASSIRIKAGNQAAQTDIVIKAGASDITVEIPKDADVIFNVQNVLGAQEIGGLTETGKGEFRNKNFGKASRLIRVDISSAVSSLKVKRY